MYLCAKGIDWTHFYNFYIEFRNWSDSVVYIQCIYFNCICKTWPIVYIIWVRITLFKAWKRQPNCNRLVYWKPNESKSRQIWSDSNWKKKTKNENISFNLNGNIIKCEDEVKLLRVAIDFELNFNIHIANIC